MPLAIPGAHDTEVARSQEGTMSRYSRWARTEHGEATRIAGLLPAAPVFLGLIPYLVTRVGPRLDRRLGLPGDGRPGPSFATWMSGGLLSDAAGAGRSRDPGCCRQGLEGGSRGRSGRALAAQDL
jgi:hypothetical protein